MHLRQFIYSKWPLILVILGLYLTTFYHFLLFHTLVELFSVTIAWMMFGVVWAAKDKTTNGFYFILGTAYLFVGFIDLIHTLAYKGMNIFINYNANLPTQLWISARYLEALSLFTAPFYLKSQPSKRLIIGIYLGVTALLITSVFMRAFPDCFLEGKGLTRFKVVSEYVICLILLAAIYLLHKKKENFKPETYWLIIAAIVTTIVAELFFTFYISVYGLSNLLGHYFKLISFYMVYKAIVRTSILDPYDTLFNDLKDRERELLEEKRLLKEAMGRIKTLEGLLPICSSCKRIRDENNRWVPVESYISERSEAQFTHGICPECLKRLYPEHYSRLSPK